VNDASTKDVIISSGPNDPTLGYLDIIIGGHPSATASNRYGYFGIGDNLAMRNLALNTNGAGAFGNVGIGTTSPSNTLQVAGGIAATTSDYVLSSAGSIGLIQPGASTGNTYTSFQAASGGGGIANNLCLQPLGGNLGIGTTSPGAALDVNGSSILRSGLENRAYFQNDPVSTYNPSSGIVAVNFAAGAYAAIPITVATSFSPTGSGSTGLVAGRVQTLDLTNSTVSPQTLAWSASWMLGNGPLPTRIAPGASLRIVLHCTGTIEAQILATIFNPGTLSFSNLSALRTFNTSSLNSTSPIIAFISGYNTLGDGGDGVFVWVPNDNYSSDNDGTLVAGGISYWSLGFGTYAPGTKVAMNQKVERGQKPALFVCITSHNPTTYGSFAAALTAGVWSPTSTIGYWHRQLGPSTQGLSQVPTTRLDVRWFGGTPDASTDVTPAVLDAFFALQFGGQFYLGDLHFPAGEYRFATKCVLAPTTSGLSVSLSGDGEFVTTFIYGLTAADTAMLDLSASGTGVSIQNIGFGWRNYSGGTVNSTDIIYIHDTATVIVDHLYGTGLTGNFLHIKNISAGICVSNINTGSQSGTQFLLDGVGGTIQGFNVNTGFSTPCFWIKNCDALKVTGGQASGGGPYKMFAGATIAGSTLTVPSPHGFLNGDYVVLSNPVLNAAYTGRYQISLPIVVAGSFIVGQQYIIAVVGSTNFITIGAASNTVGVTFTATGVGSGTGTATSLQTLFLSGLPALGNDTVRLDSLWSCLYMGGGNCTESSMSNVIWNTAGNPGVGSVGMHLDGYNGSTQGILFNNILCDYGWTGIFAHGLPNWQGYFLSASGILSVFTISSTVSTFTLTATSPADVSLAIPGRFIHINSSGMAYDGFWIVASVTATTVTVNSTLNLGATMCGCVGVILGSSVLGISVSQATTYPHDDFGGARFEGATNCTLTDVNTPGSPYFPISTVTAGSFITGQLYKIVSIGTTNFIAVGAIANTVGNNFIATGVGSGTGTASTTSNGGVSAGAFQINTVYQITSVGTTNFTLIGALANTVGTNFRATGPGSGTGTASVINNRIFIGDGQEGIPVTDIRINGGSLTDNRQVSDGWPLAVYQGIVFDGPNLWNCAAVNAGIQWTNSPVIFQNGAIQTKGLTVVYSDGFGDLIVVGSVKLPAPAYAFLGAVGFGSTRENILASIVNAVLLNIPAQTGYPSGGSITLSFSANSNVLLALSSATAITSGGLASGQIMFLIVQNIGAGPITISWPSWNVANGFALPASLAAGQIVSMVLKAFGSTDSTVYAST